MRSSVLIPGAGHSDGQDEHGDPTGLLSTKPAIKLVAQTVEPMTVDHARHSAGALLGR